MAYVKAQDAYGFLDGTSKPPIQTIPNSSTTPDAPAIIENPEYLAWCQRADLHNHQTTHCSCHRMCNFSPTWTTLVSMFVSQARSHIM